MPSSDTARSVPWSASKPRTNICSALPPPICCAIKSPGTSRIRSCDELTGRRLRSIALRVWKELLLNAGEIVTSLRSICRRTIGITIRLRLLLTFICCCWYPIKDTTSVAESAGSGSWKLPDRSVAVVLPFMPHVTLAYSTGTDRSGNFQLPLPADSATLVVSFIGYQQQQINVKSNLRRIVIPIVRRQIDLKEVTISPAFSNNSFHTLSAIDLNLRPVNSSQDLMRLVPGLFIAQHMGGGKAEQIFVRGFDADHGTDLAVSLDGIPVNMVSHIHGQGYADLHFLIPETISVYDYGKGPYYTYQGDFN